MFNNYPFEFSFGASSPRIVPLIVKVLDSFPLAFEVIVTVFVKAPTLSVAYFTPITAFAPGRIGSFGKDGTVQPHEPVALVIINGLFPLFTNTNSRFPSAL